MTLATLRGSAPFVVRFGAATALLAVQVCGWALWVCIWGVCVFVMCVFTWMWEWVGGVWGDGVVVVWGGGAGRGGRPAGDFAWRIAQMVYGCLCMDSGLLAAAEAQGVPALVAPALPSSRAPPRTTQLTPPPRCASRAAVCPGPHARVRRREPGGGGRRRLRPRQRQRQRAQRLAAGRCLLPAAVCCVPAGGGCCALHAAPCWRFVLAQERPPSVR